MPTEKAAGLRDAPALTVAPADLARLRQGAYRYFGSLFLYPTVERLAALREAAADLQREEELWSTFAFFESWRRLLHTLTGSGSAEGAAILAEYTRLLLVTPPAPPYASFYLDPQRLMGGPVTVAVAAIYRELGLTLPEGFRELPDFVAVELEFMAFLCTAESQAWERRDRLAGLQKLERQRAFLGGHLGVWFPRFARRLRGAVPSGPYGPLVEAVDTFVRHDLDLLNLMIKLLADGQE